MGKSSKLDRQTNIIQTIGYPLAAAALISTIAALLIEEKHQPVTTASISAVALVVSLVWGWKLKRTSQPTPAEFTKNLEPWLHAVGEQMRTLWVDHALGSTEHLRQDLQLRTNSSWLHPKYRNTTLLTDNEAIDLSQINGVGALYHKLNGSFLLVGEAGSGKSVALWQILEHLLNHNQIPFLIEVYRWHEYDNDPTSAVPRFEDFIAWNLKDPIFGTPPETAKRMVPQMPLLLDGLDELADIHHCSAARFLESLDRAVERNKLHPNRVITTRPNQYQQIINHQNIGIKSVANAVETTPYPIDTVIAAIEDLYPRLNNLEHEINTRPNLQILAQRPLWLSLLIDIHKHNRNIQPLSHYPPNLGLEGLQQAIYQKWLTQTTRHKPPEWRYHTGYIAHQMQTHGAQTLRLENIQLNWLPPTNKTRNKLTTGLVYGAFFGLAFGLIVGLGFPLHYGVIQAVNEEPSPNLFSGLFAALTTGPIAGLVYGLTEGLGFNSKYHKAGKIIPITNQQYKITAINQTKISIGLIAGLAVGLFTGLMSWLDDDLYIGLSDGLAIGLPTGLAVSLYSGLSDGFIDLPPQTPNNHPYQTILTDLKLRTMRHLLSLGLSVGLISGTAIGFLNGPLNGLRTGLTLTIGFGLTSGLGESLLFQHLLLRTHTSTTRKTPWKLASHLNQTINTGLMYKIGAGYRFRHRTLTQQIAKQWKPPERI